jgi:hypothetical protein
MNFRPIIYFSIITIKECAQLINNSKIHNDQPIFSNIKRYGKDWLCRKSTGKQQHRLGERYSLQYLQAELQPLMLLLRL